MNLEKLYKLSWSENDNPNGWIEPTTYCQLKCPGCYRGLDTGNVKFIHLDLEVLKKQVLDFEEKRNIQTITISGGEPLMYPQIEELVKFISGRGLFIKIFTNGILLNEAMLLKLKKAGVSEFVVHVDMFQDLPGYKGKNEIDMLELKQKYVDLFKKVGGVNLGFILPMSKDNIMYLPEIIKFYRRNIENINLVIFSVLKDPAIKNNNNKLDFNIEYLSKEIAKHTPYLPSVYLPKTKNHNLPAWLFSTGFGNNEVYFGDVSSKVTKRVLESYYKKHGKHKYTYEGKGEKIKLLSLLGLIFFNSGRKILKNIIKSKNKDIFYQLILLIEPPSEQGDWCHGCPDMMYVGDKMYNSCLINNCKEFKDKFLKK